MYPFGHIDTFIKFVVLIFVQVFPSSFILQFSLQVYDFFHIAIISKSLFTIESLVTNDPSLNFHPSKIYPSLVGFIGKTMLLPITFIILLILFPPSVLILIVTILSLLLIHLGFNLIFSFTIKFSFTILPSSLIHPAKMYPSFFGSVILFKELLFLIIIFSFLSFTT